MSKEQLEALVISLIALCQRENILPTESDSLCDELQLIASDEVYISKSELDYFLN